jgi:N-acetylglutamate synthase-like GNAT family acetyltransferase
MDHRHGEFHVRLATVGDVDDVRELIRRSMWGLGAADYTRAQVRSLLSHVMGVDTQLVRDGTYFVVTDGEANDARIVGCGGWSCRRLLYGGDAYKGAGADERLDPSRDAARIRAFFIDPDFARRGIARLLLDLCERAAAHAGFAQLELSATRTGEHFYRACGFEVVERIETTLPGGVTVQLARMTRAIRRDATR